ESNSPTTAAIKVEHPFTHPLLPPIDAW
ncbi:unnamed protein product, partial [Rotaria sordida]